MNSPDRSLSIIYYHHDTFYKMESLPGCCSQGKKKNDAAGYSTGLVFRVL